MEKSRDGRPRCSQFHTRPVFVVIAAIVGLLGAAACTDTRNPTNGNRVAVAGSNGEARAREPFHEGFTPTKLDSASLTTFRSIKLGQALTEIAIRPSDFIVGPRDIVVADLASRSVLRYDRDGQFSARYTHVDTTLLGQPYRLRRVGDSLFVLDLTGAVRVARITSGETLSMVDSGVPSAPDFAVAPGVIFYSRTMNEPGEVTRGLIEARSPLGGPRWEACPPSPVLAASLKRTGAIGAHQVDTRVVVVGTTVYCSQPSSPSIQMYGLTGTYLGRFDRVPPSYRSPTDMPNSISGFRQLEASWMPITKIWPWATGIAVQRVVRDTVADRFRSFLFVCDSTQGSTHCTDNAIPYHVVNFSPPDTVWGIDNSKPTGPLLIGSTLVRHNR